MGSGLDPREAALVCPDCATVKEDLRKLLAGGMLEMQGSTECHETFLVCLSALLLLAIAAPLGQLRMLAEEACKEVFSWCFGGCVIPLPSCTGGMLLNPWSLLGL